MFKSMVEGLVNLLRRKKPEGQPGRGFCLITLDDLKLAIELLPVGEFRIVPVSIFEIPQKARRYVAQRAHYHGKRAGKKFVVRSISGGVKFWRIE